MHLNITRIIDTPRISTPSARWIDTYFEILFNTNLTKTLLCDLYSTWFIIVNTVKLIGNIYKTGHEDNILDLFLLTISSTKLWVTNSGAIVFMTHNFWIKVSLKFLVLQYEAYVLFHQKMCNEYGRYFSASHITRIKG